MSRLPPSFDPSPDLVGVLDYLRDIGYEELYAPTEPYFDRSWRLPDLEKVE